MVFEELRGLMPPRLKRKSGQLDLRRCKGIIGLLSELFTLYFPDNPKCP